VRNSQATPHVHKNSMPTRRDWAAVGTIPVPRISKKRVLEAFSLLPERRTAPRVLVKECRHLARRWQYSLHMNEFGPTRAERIAALTELQLNLRSLRSDLSKLPAHLYGSRFKRFDAAPASSGDRDIVLTRLIGGSTVAGLAKTLEDALQSASEIDVSLISRALKLTRNVASSLMDLDPRTKNSIAVAAIFPSVATSSLGRGTDDLATVNQGLVHLEYCVDQLLADLKRRRGPDARVSLPSLVWTLCDLWQRETGEPVTSSAKCGRYYTGIPRSSSGRFILAAVEALAPPTEWRRLHARWGATTRDRTFGPMATQRIVYFAMRGYVAAHHPA
jgi:hypothetical protein